MIGYICDVVVYLYTKTQTQVKVCAGNVQWETPFGMLKSRHFQHKFGRNISE